MSNNKLVEALINKDVVGSQQKELNKKVSEFNAVDMLSTMAKNLEHAEHKKEVLSSLGDTYLSMAWDEFLLILEREGFKIGYTKPITFEYKTREGDKETEELYVLFYNVDKGLVIKADTFDSKSVVNSCELIGQIQSNIEFEYEDQRKFNLIVTEELTNLYEAVRGCSHGPLINVTEGLAFSYDGRQGLLNKINSLESSYKFNSVWSSKDIPFLHFTTHKENMDDKDYEEVTYEKLIECPEDFKRIIDVWFTRFASKRQKTRPSMKDLFSKFLR